MDTLADAIDALCEAERGFHFTSRSQPDSTISHLALRSDVRRLARKLRLPEDAPGDRLVIAVPDQRTFLLLFLAVIRAGLVAVPVPPPGLTADLTAYSTDIERIRRVCGARRILTTDSLHQRLQANHPPGSLVPWSELQAGEETGELGRPTTSSTALIQFTSGSTGSPKGVELTHGNVISNARAIEQALAIDPVHDRGLSWLPFHHDMGLMGFLIAPVLIQASTWYLPPMEFARQPRRWLELMSQTEATISYAPNFAYEMAARSVKKAQCRDWNLSAWRVAGCGGEPVLPEVLEHFARQLEPAGFNRKAFVPSYGLAEATVAVAISAPQRGVILQRARSANGDGTTAVSSGRAIKDTAIRIVSSDNTELADGKEGDIQVRGPGVARRLWCEDGPQPSTRHDGWLSTGDNGFLYQGELHVTGRNKETIVINGRNYHAHDIEECVQDLEGIRRGGIVAFGRPQDGSEQLVLVAENRSVLAMDTIQHQLRAAIRQRLGLAVADIVIVERGIISRTTSGKIRRHALKQAYLAGEFTRLSSDSLESARPAVACT
ncbi:AMP-binding protein [Granulosicoccus sp. 3-233]|uniref:AMP-binding protein n=1 Tax=Granulosicoccus sp. 3-233 TaxID=3417969 RepID=UPI003D32C47A